MNYDDCATVECRNNGTCEDGIDNYTCTCVPGYEGTHCTVEINECSTHPCVYGNCTDLLNDFQVILYTVLLTDSFLVTHSLLQKGK